MDEAVKGRLFEPFFTTKGPGKGTGLGLAEPASTRLDIYHLVREVLSRSGYTVLMASDPHEALSILADPPGPISLLLTDVVMPHMSGRELATVCQARQPGLRVLYMSGYTNDTLGPRGLLDPGIVLVQKPFAGPLLLQRVRAVLDARVG